MRIVDIIKENKKALLFIFLLALVIRLAYLFSITHLPTFNYPLLDAEVHASWAKEIITTDFWGKAAFFRAPLYAYFLALLFKVFNQSFFAARVVQLFIGSLSCGLIYILALQIFKKRAIAVIAGLMSVFYWVFIYFEAEFLIPVLFVFLCLLAFIFLLEAAEEKRAGMFVVSGLLFGLSAIARPNILIFMPFGFFWIIFVLRKVLAAKKIAVAAMIFTLAVSIPALIVTARNYAIGDDLAFIASQGGVNFYIGNNEYSDGKTAIVPGTRGTFWGGYFDTINIAQQEVGRVLMPSEVSAYWFGRGFKFIKDQPQQALKLYLHKLHLFWDNVEHSNNKNIYFFREQSEILRFPLFISFALLAPLGLAGFVLAGKDRNWWLFTAFVFIYMLSVLLFFVNARYKVPLLPIMVIYAAFTIYEFYRAALEKDFRGSIKIIAIVMFFAVILQLNASSKPDLTKVNDGYYILANAHFRRGEYDRAFELYQKTTVLKHPYKSRSYKNLAHIYVKRGRVKEALKEYETAIKEELALLPEVASELLGEGRVRVFVELLKSLRGVDAAVIADGYKRVGDYYIRQRNFDDAKHYYLLAVENDAQNIASLINLANIYSADKKGFAKAENYYQKALVIQPNSVPALRNLAQLYRQDGRFDEAAELMNLIR